MLARIGLVVVKVLARRLTKIYIHDSVCYTTVTATVQLCRYNERFFSIGGNPTYGTLLLIVLKESKICVKTKQCYGSGSGQIRAFDKGVFIFFLIIAIGCVNTNKYLFPPDYSFNCEKPSKISESVRVVNVNADSGSTW